MTIRTSTVLKANMPIGQTGQTSAQDIHDIVETFAARTKCLNDYFVAGDSNPSHDAMVRLFASIQNGDNVYIDAGTHVINSQITLSAKNGVTIEFSRAATIRAGTHGNWGTAGYLTVLGFEDCNDLTITGGVFDGNEATAALIGAGVYWTILGVTSNVAMTSMAINSRRISVSKCRFINLYRSGLTMRQIEHAVVQDCVFESNGAASSTNPLFSVCHLSLALANRVRVSSCTFDGAVAGPTGTTLNYVGGISASPGQGLGGTIYKGIINGGRFAPFGNIRALEWQAPAGGVNTATVNWDALSVFDSSFVASEMKFFHLVKNRAGKFDIPPNGIVCTAINNTGPKTITFQSRNMRGALAPLFDGQTIVSWGYKKNSLMKDLVVENCLFKDQGVGLFLWGVDGYVVTGNHCLNGGDISLDAEMSINGVFSNNVIQSNQASNSGIAILEMAHNVAVTGNTIIMESSLYGIQIETGGPLITNVTVSGNTVKGGEVRLRGGGQRDGSNNQGGCNIGYVNITGNTIDGGKAPGAEVHGYNVSIDFVNVCRDIVVRGNLLDNAGTSPVAYTGVDGLVIADNSINHTYRTGIAYEFPVGTVNASRRVVICNNLFNDTNHEWRGEYGLLRRDGTTSTEQPRMYGNYSPLIDHNYAINTIPQIYDNGVKKGAPGPLSLQVGSFMLRDNAGALQKSTNATGPLDAAATWTTIT